jgi:enamine deaminase RidA (YjgF/YER057c/UK114 family)
MKRGIVNPKESQPMYDAFHFSQANRVGDTIWVSGQVGVDANLSPASGMAAQAQLAFEGLKRTLVATGASLDDVVELMTFHIDLRGEMEAFAKVKDEYFPRDYPAWTAVGVTQLALPELRVEIRAVAIAGSGRIETP